MGRFVVKESDKAHAKIEALAKERNISHAEALDTLLFKDYLDNSNKGQPSHEPLKPECLFGYWRKKGDEFNRDCYPQLRNPALRSPDNQDILKYCNMCDMKQKALIRYKFTTTHHETEKQKPWRSYAPSDFKRQEPPSKIVKCRWCEFTDKEGAVIGHEQFEHAKQYREAIEAKVD